MKNKNRIEFEMVLTSAIVCSSLAKNLSLENYVKDDSKRIWRGIASRTENIVSQIKSEVHKDVVDEIDNKIVNNDENGTFVNLIYYYGMMNNDQRKELEKECEKIMNF